MIRSCYRMVSRTVGSPALDFAEGLAKTYCRVMQQPAKYTFMLVVTGKIKCLVLVISVLFCHVAYCKNKEEILFGGTMLSFTATNTPPSHVAFEQFLIYNNSRGFYDQNSHLQKSNSFSQYQALPYIKFGLTNNLDINIISSLVYSASNTSSQCSPGDTTILAGIQLMKEKGHLIPDVRFLIGESFPTGKFDNLDPEMFLGDAVGTGSFETILLLSLAKIFYYSKNHGFRLNPNFYFIIPTPTKISGISTHSGGLHAKGIVHPGLKFAFDLPIEINITNNLFIGADVYYLNKARSVFDPKSSSVFQTGLPSSYNLSIAPCIEYNPSKKLGLEGAVWFSVKGKNSLAFTTMIGLIWFYF